jgi:aminomethyltransferase
LELRKTPLYDLHIKYGGRIIDFEGWALPVQYSGIIDEHINVRNRVGLFDVSHMGEISVKGKCAGEFVQKLITNNVSILREGRIIYSPICNDGGGIVDDVMVYRISGEYYLLVVNASNTEKDFRWMVEKKIHGVSIENFSYDISQLAVQGPCSEKVLSQITDFAISDLGYFCFKDNVSISKTRALISRTGYTGEDGFEIYCSPENAKYLWEDVMEAGEKYCIKPAGLGARDTLRFEACMPLYGHELTDDINPLEAGLERYVRMEKDEFIGRSALLKMVKIGVPRRRIGLRMMDKGIPRKGNSVFKDNEQIGRVTSGSYSPTLGNNFGMAIVRSSDAVIGDLIDINVRGKMLKAEIIDMPFYKRKI